MMNRIFVVFLSLLLLGVGVFVPTSCRRSYPEDPRLSALKALGDSQPREALSRLDALKDSVSVLSLYERRRYDLLRLRLQDKSDLIPESDSTPKALCAYFERHGSPADRMEAYYYLASVYRDLHDSPQAITYFLKCAEMPDRYQGMDSALLINAYSQLCRLYRLHFDHRSELRMAEKEVEVARRIGCEDPITLMDAATANRRLKDTLNTLRYQDEALRMILADGDIVRHGHNLAEMLTTYVRYGQSAKADTCLRLLARVPVSRLPVNYDINMGIYYAYTSQIDSAIYYYKKTYSKQTNNALSDGSRNLVWLYARKGDSVAAARWGLRYIEAEAALKRERRVEQSINAHNEFVYRRDREAEAAAYRAAREARQLLWLWLGLAGLLIVCITVGLLVVKLRSSRREQNRLREILEKDRKIQAGKAETARLRQHLDAQQQEIGEKNEQLRKRLVQNEQLMKYALMTRFGQSSEGGITARLMQASEGRQTLTDDDWHDFLASMDEAYPGFRGVLVERVDRLTDDLVRIGYLLKAGFSQSQIVSLTGYGKTTVWRKVKQLTAVLGEELKGGL